MEEKNWVKLDYDLMSSLQESDQTELIKYIRDNQQLLISKWLLEEYEDLDNSLQIGNTLLGLVEAATKEHKLISNALLLGELKGTINTLQSLGLEQKKRTYEKSLEEEINEKRYLIAPHFKEVVNALSMYGALTHEELSHKTDLKKTTLTENLKNDVYIDIIKIQSNGKYKLYYLSEYGKAVAKKIKKEANPKNKVVEESHEAHKMTWETKYFDYKKYPKIDLRELKIESEKNINEKSSNKNRQPFYEYKYQCV